MGLILQNTTTPGVNKYQLRKIDENFQSLEDIIWPLINLLQCRISMILHIFRSSFTTTTRILQSPQQGQTGWPVLKPQSRQPFCCFALTLTLTSEWRGGSAGSGLAALGCCCLQLQSAMTLSTDRDPPSSLGLTPQDCHPPDHDPTHHDVLRADLVTPGLSGCSHGPGVHWSLIMPGWWRLSD